jgi:hypothetical protein
LEARDAENLFAVVVCVGRESAATVVDEDAKFVADDAEDED